MRVFVWYEGWNTRIVHDRRWRSQLSNKNDCLHSCAAVAMMMMEGQTDRPRNGEIETAAEQRTATTREPAKKSDRAPDGKKLFLSSFPPNRSAWPQKPLLHTYISTVFSPLYVRRLRRSPSSTPPPPSCRSSNYNPAKMWRSARRCFTWFGRRFVRLSSRDKSILTEWLTTCISLHTYTHTHTLSHHMWGAWRMITYAHFLISPKYEARLAKKTNNWRLTWPRNISQNIFKNSTSYAYEISFSCRNRINSSNWIFFTAFRLEKIDRRLLCVHRKESEQKESYAWSVMQNCKVAKM